MEILMGLCVGMAFFIATITAYIFGVKHGRIVKNEGVPNINPIKAVVEYRKDADSKRQMDIFSRGMENILNFGEPFEKTDGRR